MSDNTSIVNMVSDTIQHLGKNLGEINSFTWSKGIQTECTCTPLAASKVIGRFFVILCHLLKLLIENSNGA